MLPEPQTAQELRIARIGTKRIHPPVGTQAGQLTQGPALVLEPQERGVLLAECGVYQCDAVSVIAHMRTAFHPFEERPGSTLIAAEPIDRCHVGEHPHALRSEWSRRGYRLVCLGALALDCVIVGVLGSSPWISWLQLEHWSPLRYW
jgi:hypothetical protein